jgi:2-polyprenyl-3-methyl-5-hydroxy-6-metoxy-1,4-benzoquinol methylase
VIEHVEQPKEFLKKLVDICKGFLFVYSPYNETERMPAHINTITKLLYEGFNIENLSVINSMGWHANIDEYMCLLAVIDCTDKLQ